MIKIGAIDSLTKDCIIRLSACQNAQIFLARPAIAARLEKNDKMILSESEYNEFAALTAKYTHEEYIGGSAFNTCSTIAAALDEVKVSFITPPSSNKGALTHTKNLEFMPLDPADAHLVIPRVSFICLDERGNKLVLKYLGNIYEYLKTHSAYLENLKNSLNEIITNADLFFLPGGITKKFPYEIFSHALDVAAKSKAKLIFALPTHSDFNAEEIALYKRALTQSSIILGNADEMKSTVGAVEELKKLNATSLITDGANDAQIIVDGHITHIKPLILPANVASLTGAGDAAYAGFIIGLLQKQTSGDCARIAMIFANEVLKIASARLLEPGSILQKIIKN